MVTKDAIFNIVHEAAEEKGLQVPEELESDFNNHFPKIHEVRSFTQLRVELCGVIKKILKKDEKFADKYMAFYCLISPIVRFKIAILLGFENYVQTPGREDNRSPREILIAYLNTLHEGESWNSESLRKWDSTNNTGRNLIVRTGTVAGNWNLDIVKAILGEKADQLLARNPFTKLENTFTNIYIVRYYLKQYLASLEPGETWSYTTLSEYNFGEEFKAISLVMYINSRYGNNKFTEEAVRKVLGKEADKLLEKNPFTKRVLKLTSRKNAKAALKEMLSDLKRGEKWSIHPFVENWKGKSGISGHSLYKWIQRNLGDFTEDTIRELLDDEADELLQRNPFEIKLERKIHTIQDLKNFFQSFLDCLPEGAFWSPKTLIMFTPRDKSIPNGSVIYNWVKNHISYEGKIDWMFILFELIPIDELKKHPFRHKTIGTVNITQGPRQSVPADTSKREIELARIADTHGSVPIDPEKLLLAKESVERIIEKRLFFSEIYKYLEISEWILMQRFCDGENLEEDEIYYLLSRIREIFLEYKPYLFDDDLNLQED